MMVEHVSKGTIPTPLGPRERRAVVAVLAVLGLATAGTLVVVGTLSTTGYDVWVGQPVADVPEDASVVEYDRLDPETRRLVAAAAGDASRVAVDRSPDSDLLAAAYVKYGGAYRPAMVETRRTVTAPGKVALGLVYLAALAAVLVVPSVRFSRYRSL